MGISPAANILRLAAVRASSTRSAPRMRTHFCSLCSQRWVLVRVPKRPTAKPSVFLAPATGIEPITTP